MLVTGTPMPTAGVSATFTFNLKLLVPDTTTSATTGTWPSRSEEPEARLM
jgi:hypothetical protein